MHVLAITLPIFILIGFGYFLRQWGVLNVKGIDVLNSFVYRLSLPAAILSAFWSMDWTRGDVRQTLIINVLIIFAVGTFLLLVGKILGLHPHKQAALFMGTLVGNTIYMGFPIGQAAFTSDIYPLFLAAATPHLAVGIFFSELVLEHLLHEQKTLRMHLLSAIKNPIILALGAGVILSFVSNTSIILGSIQKAISLVAATASPIALIALGAFLFHRIHPITQVIEGLTIAMKILIFPIAILTLGFLVPTIDRSIIAVSAVAAAMPTAVSMFAVAAEHQISPKSVANVILWGTLLSLATINALLALFI